MNNNDVNAKLHRRVDQLSNLFDCAIEKPLADIEEAAAEFAKLREAYALVMRGADMRFSLMSTRNQSDTLAALRQAEERGPETLTPWQRQLLYCIGTPEAVQAAENLHAPSGQ